MESLMSESDIKTKERSNETISEIKRLFGDEAMEDLLRGALEQLEMAICQLRYELGVEPTIETEGHHG